MDASDLAFADLDLDAVAPVTERTRHEQVMTRDSALRLDAPQNRPIDGHRQSRSACVLRECARHVQCLRGDGGGGGKGELANRAQLTMRNAAMIADVHQTIVDCVLPRPHSDQNGLHALADTRVAATSATTACANAASSLPSPPNRSAARQEIQRRKLETACSSGAALIAGLKRATHAGERPPFSDEAARIHYVHEYAPQRCLTFSVALFDVVANRELGRVLLARRDALTPSLPPPCYAISVGGGPGFDLIALSLVGAHLLALRKYRGSVCDNSADHDGGDAVVRPLSLRVVDNESGWQTQVDEMAARCLLYAGVHAHAVTAAGVEPPPWTRSECAFEWGDVTSGALVAAPDDERHTAARTDLYVFQYVILENAVLLRNSAWGMVREVLQRAKCGAIVYVVDSSDALFPELCALARDVNCASERACEWQCHVPKASKSQKSPNALMLVLVARDGSSGSGGAHASDAGAEQ